MPQLLGIVNITEDSFYDGGRYLTAPAAILQARHLIADGADIIDLGPAASNPHAASVPAALEIERLAPVIDALTAEGILLSIDSWQAETQRYGITRQVAYLNDIQGFPDPAVYPDLAAADCRLIVMHGNQDAGRAVARDVPAAEIGARIHRFFEHRLEALVGAGIARDRLILDPGMGLFLSTAPEASLKVLATLPRLKEAFGLPVLVSVSRKSFLRRLIGRENSGAATLAAELHAALSGADYIRTHDPGALRDALRIWEAIAGQGAF